MNPAAILSLIADLYEQIAMLRAACQEKDARIAELEARIGPADA